MHSRPVPFDYYITSNLFRMTMNAISRFPNKLVLAGLLSTFAILHAAPSLAQNNNNAKSGAGMQARSSAASHQTVAVPAALIAAAESGEGIYDAVLANDWPQAQTQLTALKRAASEISQTAGSDTTAKLKKIVSALDAEVPAKQRQSAMRDANEATRLVAQLTRSYHPAVPIDVVMLDYYGREMQVWATARDMPKLATTKAAIARTWNQVRPQVVARGQPGEAEARTFDDQVKQVESAKAPADYEKFATPFLEAVDRLEKVF